jgi:hypothetical protein
MEGQSSPSASTSTMYDLIVVGSGNGACGFLSECLENVPDDYRILVLEEGQDFYKTSAVTHENGWSKTYSSGGIFRLHNARTRDNRAIISGRAVTMGGGGSINYTMIHESSDWLAKHIGKDAAYWEKAKTDFSRKLDRPNPFEKKKDFTSFITSQAISQEELPFNEPNMADNFAGNIPSLNEGADKQLYIFPTQFDQFGMRTNSGVSLIDWHRDKRIEIKCRNKVEKLNISNGTCNSVDVFDAEMNRKETYSIKSGGRFVLCCGSASPRLLMRSKELTNEHIGKYVRDHICMPLGFYVVAEDQHKLIGPTNNYESIFATSKIKTGEGDETGIVNIDFFSGELDRLIFLVSSLYLAFVPFNSLKRLMSTFPFLFTIISNVIRVTLVVLVFLLNVLQGVKDVLTLRGWGATKIKITTSLLKFNTCYDGQYEDRKDAITLGFFDDKKDFVIAEEAIKKNISFLESLGAKPFFLLRWVFQFLTKIPYKETEVKKFVRNFSKNALLSEQHLAGGCLFGKVIDKGEEDASAAGRVFGTNNIHVADLSTVPLPRVSTQMTAYMIGHHVGKQLFSSKKKD